MALAKKKASPKKKKSSKKKAPSRKKYKNLNLKKKSKKRVSKKKSAKKKAAQRRAKVRKSVGKKSKKRKPTSKKSKKKKVKRSSRQASAGGPRMDSSLMGPSLRGPWTEVVSLLEDRIIVERVKIKEQSSVGIIIPESAVTATESHGKVLQVGQGRRDRRGQLRPMEVSIGDKVVFPAVAGVEMEINGVEVVILRENEVWGVLTQSVTTYVY